MKNVRSEGRQQEISGVSKIFVKSIRKAPKTFSKTIQFDKINANAYCEKTVRDTVESRFLEQVRDEQNSSSYRGSR